MQYTIYLEKFNFEINGTTTVIMAASRAKVESLRGTANTISAALRPSRLHTPYDVPQDARNRAPGTIFESGHLPITRQARIATHCGAAPAADEYGGYGDCQSSCLFGIQIISRKSMI